MIRRAIPLLHISSAAEAVEFYCQGLGFQLEFEHRPEGVTGGPVLPGHLARRCLASSFVVQW